MIVPEMSQPSPESPATGSTKAYLAALAQETAKSGVFHPALPEIGIRHSHYYAPITGDQSGDVVWAPEGKAEDPSLKGNIAIEDDANEGIRLIDDYRIRQIPDGWDVEKHTRLVSSASSSMPGTELQTLDEARSELDKLNTREETRKRAEQMARELGLAALSEGEARWLIDLLKEQHN